MIRELAERVKEEAEHATPIGQDERREHVIYFYKVVQYPTMARVINTDPFFHLVEWGSVNNPPYAPLRRGVTAAGLRLDEDVKGE